MTPADTLPAMTLKPWLRKQLAEYHRETWIGKRDAIIANAVNKHGGSLRDVGELVGLSHTQVAEIAKRARGEK